MSNKQSKYSYTTSNTLADNLAITRANKAVETKSMWLIREVEEELANHCQVSRDFIVAIKRGNSQPSLAVALKIAQYFNLKVEDIFKLEGENENGNN